MHIDLRALTYHRHDTIHVIQIEAWVNTLAIEIHSHDHNIHITSALAIPQQRTLDALGTCHHR